MPDHHRPAGAAPSRDGTFLFFTAALGITWLLQLPAVLAMTGIIAGPVERYILPALLGGFGPVGAAVLAARWESGGAGVRALFRRMLDFRAGAGWYAVALLIFAAIYVSGSAVYRLAGGGDPGRWLYLPENGQQIVAMLVIPFAEEPGWRGFALPRLQRRYDRLTSSLLLGGVWAAWHTMMFVLQGLTPLAFALCIVNVVAGSVVFSWLFNRTRESLPIAVLAHVGVHWNNPYHALPERLTPVVIYTAAILVATCGLLVLDRKAWRSTIGASDAAHVTNDRAEQHGRVAIDS